MGIKPHLNQVSLDDNLSSYIVWGRVLTAFRTMRGQSIIERTFSKPKEEGTISEKILRVQEILEYLGYKYVYPMFDYLLYKGFTFFINRNLSLSSLF